MTSEVLRFRALPPLSKTAPLSGIRVSFGLAVPIPFMREHFHVRA
jgi:hypothetical protein